MKKVVLGIFAVVLTMFWACQKDQLSTLATQNSDGLVLDRGANPGGGDASLFGMHCMSGDTVDAATLPADAIAYIAANYAVSTVANVVARPFGYAVELSTGEILLFDSAGAFKHLCGGGGHSGGGHPHDSTWTGGGHGGHHPHDSLWVGGHPHDSLWVGGHPHDSTWTGGGHGGHHPQDSTWTGGGTSSDSTHTGGGHGGGHGGGGGHGHGPH